MRLYFPKPSLNFYLISAANFKLIIGVRIDFFIIQIFILIITSLFTSHANYTRSCVHSQSELGRQNVHVFVSWTSEETSPKEERNAKANAKLHCRCSSPLFSILIWESIQPLALLHSFRAASPSPSSLLNCNSSQSTSSPCQSIPFSNNPNFSFLSNVFIAHLLG